MGTLLSNYSWSQQSKQHTDQKRYAAIKAKPAIEQKKSDEVRATAFNGVEDLEKRTKNAKHFRNANGTYTAQIGGNYHYKDANGKWQDIDLNIGQGVSGMPGYGFQNVTNDVKSYFPQHAGTEGVIMRLENGSEFTWWKNPQFRIVSSGNAVNLKRPSAVPGTVSGEKLSYPDLYPNISEEFVVLNGGIENNLVLNALTPELAALSAGSTLEFSQFIPLQNGWQIFNAEGKAMTGDFRTTDFSLQLGNADSKIYFGRVTVFDRAISKQEAMLIHAPADKLSAEQKKQLEQSVYTITYQVRFVNGGVEIISALPASWLQASGRSFPVTIDPTVTITPAGVESTFYGPMSHWYGYQRHATLYLQSEIGIYGTITDIEYNSTTTGTAGSRPTKVYMQKTPNTTLSAGIWNSATYTGGSQLCLDQNTDQGNTTGWKMLSLTAPFIYDQDNLMIMVLDAWGGSGSTKYYNISPTPANRQAYSRVDGTDPGDGASLSIENRLSEIRITYVPSATCTGLPASVTASADASAICPTVPINLSLTGMSIQSGISVQWESSTDGGTTWNPLGAPQSGLTYTVTGGQTVETQYRAVVTCVPTSDEVTSSVVTVTMSAPVSCGCTPAASNCSLDDEIQNVTFAGIDNNSTCSTGGYGDYRASVSPASVVSGLSYPITVTTGEGGNEAVAVWIDYNQNGVYELSEYAYIGNTAGGTVNTTLNIPGAALAGTTSMRVRSFYIASGDPLLVYEDTPNSACATISTGYGETEDYLVTIAAGANCSGAPDAGTISASETIVCLNEPITLTSDASNPVVGVEYQWQASVDGGATWTDLGTASGVSTYTVPSQSEETMYHLIATCTLTGDADTSASVTVDQQVPTQCYCINAIPFNCTDGDLITNVTIGSINNNSACGSTSTGYSDYTTSVAPANIQAGTTVPVSVSVGPSGGGWMYESVGVWIDYNQNGLLDSIEGEYTNVGTGLNQALTANIAIPATALPGPTRMRVVVTASITGLHAYVCGPIDEDENYGEMEDYTLNILSTVVVDSVVVETQGGVPAQITTPAGTLQLEATVYPLTVNQDVTWSVIPVTGGATISATGLVTAQANGTVWAKAVSDEDPTKADSILVTISNQTVIGVDSVVVTTVGGVPAQITTPAGTLQLQAAVYPLTVSQNVTWSLIPVTGSATISTGGLVTASGNGTVWAKAVSVADATKADSILITITNQDLGVATLNLSDFALYPNPTTDFVTLKSAEEHGALNLTIMDVAGKVVFSDQLTGNALHAGYQVELGSYSNGIYILRLTGSDTNIQRQIIKK
ncbi:T9SS type A sorting domain-containing protein [Fluviicola sp.]|uniref:T9SS type A sorting domain-containing protein n=1 Tax=Fluviicola sp. TaxID=1917219 RepID=UPI0031D5E0A0